MPSNCWSPTSLKNKKKRKQERNLLQTNITTKFIIIFKSIVNRQGTPSPDLLRGAITKKTGKFGKNSQRGGGLKKTDENSQFQFGNFEKKKCLNYKSGSDPILKRRIEN